MLNNSSHAQTARTTKISKFSESVQCISQLFACVRSLILIDRGKTFQKADMFKMSIFMVTQALTHLSLRKRGNIVAEAKLHPGRKKCFWKISKAFSAFKTQILCLKHMLLVGANE